jgi:integrase
MGREEIVRTLGTRDLTLAKRKLHAVLADIQRDIAAAEARREFPPESAEYVLQAAQEARAAVAKGLMTQGAAELAMDATVDNHLDLLTRQRGVDPETGDPLMSDGHARAIQLAHRVFAGEPVTLLSAQAEAHLSEIASTVRKQTLADKRKALQALRDWLAMDVEVTAVTRKVAGKYLTESLMKTGVAAKTIQTRLSHISSCWNWMMARGVVEVNPWLRMASSLPKDKRGSEAPRRPWTDEELVKLLKGTPTNDPMWTLAALGMYTGARIEELCSLKVADVTGDALRIREGKSAAAVRTLPMHPVIAPLVKRLVSTATDGYLIPGLLTGGRDARRSAGAVKRFGYHLRHHIGITDTALTFHSLRHTFTNRCEIAGVPEPTTKLLTGHSRGESLTYGHYSKGLPLTELAKAVAKVTYGPADALVKRTSGKVKITIRSRRRPTRSAAAA